MYHQRFKTLEERFEEKFDRAGENDCWLWKAGRSRPQEHPKIRLDGGYKKASKVSLLLYRGQDAGDMHVCHSCDTPLCVNPNHLFLGTHLLNMQDKVSKGRSHRPAGRKNPKSKLTKLAAQKIAADLERGELSQQEIARKYEIGQSTVSEIKRGRHWTQQE
ncbi:HNH endonuclease protein [Rhizobium phage RHph_Y1_10]|nr:HNH endonuclease protein [Rhizobium phage RHph_Y1_10]